MNTALKKLTIISDPFFGGRMGFDPDTMDVYMPPEMRQEIIKSKGLFGTGFGEDVETPEEKPGFWTKIGNLTTGVFQKDTAVGGLLASGANNLSNQLNTGALNIQDIGSSFQQSVWTYNPEGNSGGDKWPIYVGGGIALIALVLVFAGMKKGG